ncbi:MAG: response regulator [Methanomassiliicoccales archaeon]|jgi:CheY-like chemotaxis protein
MNHFKKPLRVLLVEKDQQDIFLIKGMLRDTGFDLQITVSESGQKALQMLNRAIGGHDRRIDLVILDLDLPDVNGLEILSYMKSMRGIQMIPVLVMTHSLDKDEEMRAMGMGAVDYIIKPSCHAEFQAMLDRIMGELGKLDDVAP